VTDEDGLEIIVAPGVTQEQVAVFLDLLSDAFVHVGGKGGLVIEPIEEKRP
jgi:hypothetical protein